MNPVMESALQAKKAFIEFSKISTKVKDKALQEIAKALDKNRKKIITENNKDMIDAKKENFGEVLQKRLMLDDKKIDELILGLKDLVKLKDPIGETIEARELDKGLELFRVRCPIGVIGVIFESRPDALVQISSLCLKSSNSVFLKGGKEAKNTNKVLFEIIRDVSMKNGIPKGWIQLLETRDDVKDMLKLNEHIDLVVPRGSNAFVQYVMQNTKIPVLGHADGICHVYVDSRCDLKMALNIIEDSKCQYAAVCNAMETLLVDEAVAEKLLPIVKERLAAKGVRLLGDEKTRKIIDIEKAIEKDWNTEYNDLVLSIKVVENISEAIEHINKYGSGHTDAIVTKDRKNADEFMQRVDSANVFWNSSTRFADGFRYGLGAEVGISTGKIHSRGPVGLEGLTIYKWKLIGKGQVVADYATGKSKFTHKKINKRPD